MSFNNAVLRINNIRWENIGDKPSDEYRKYGCEFLRRLANFYDTKKIKHYPPLFSNLAKILGDSSDIDYTEYYDEKTSEFLNETLYKSKIVEYYLQLSLYAEDNVEFVQYLDIYEPMIRLYERGGSFKLRINDLEIVGVIFIPLNNWFEKFKNKSPYIIEE